MSLQYYFCMPEIRAVQDNVILRFLPPPTKAPGGLLFIPDTTRPEPTTRAEVVAVGPGYYRDSGHGRFIPTTVRPGEIVLVERRAGQDYALDINVPRTNKETGWADEHGNFRVVREDEILAVIEAD